VFCGNIGCRAADALDVALLGRFGALDQCSAKAIGRLVFSYVRVTKKRTIVKSSSLLQ
jgi:hypothetical protein